MDDRNVFCFLSMIERSSRMAGAGDRGIILQGRYSSAKMSYFVRPTSAAKNRKENTSGNALGKQQQKYRKSKIGEQPLEERIYI